MASQTKFILITLGEELLLGLTPNGHLTYIGDQLRQGGATLHANITISDHPKDIEEHFRHYWAKADVLITTGGLGPTADDRTKDVIGEALDQKQVFDPSIMAAIEERFRERRLVLTENNRKQADRYEDSEVLENPNGTAPGLWLEKDGKILVMLPGPPFELQPMFENKVLPRLRARNLIDTQESYIQIRTTNVGESYLESMLQPIIEKNPGLDVAYCAHPGMVDFRLSFPDTTYSTDALVAIACECQELLGENFLCAGNDTLVEIVSKILRQSEKTLAFAESCTGGLLANEVTNLSGASTFFRGSLVTYCDKAKQEILGVPAELIEERTAVSSEVAIAMAKGAATKLGADFAISVTGYLGPTGGTSENPVGTVFIGLHTQKRTEARRFLFKGPRNTIKRRVVNAAFDWLRKEIR